MELLTKIDSFYVKYLFPFNNTIFLNRNDSGHYKGLYKYENGKVIDLGMDLFYFGVEIENLFFWQTENGKNLIIFNKQFEVVKEVAGEIYFAIEQTFKDKLRIIIQTGEKQNAFLIDSKFKLLPIGLMYVFELNHGFIGRGYGDRVNIMRYSLSHEIIWQVNIAELCENLLTDTEDSEETPIHISSQIFGNEDTVFVPISRHRLVALNAQDGSLKWISPPEINIGYPVYFDGLLYNNTGETLEEIDPKNGNVLRQITYKDFPILKDIKGVTGEHRVYNDFIILKDQMSGYVIMIDRLSLKPVELVSVGESVHADNHFFHWCNNELYVLTWSRLYVFGRKES